ncbi:hypothetical protein KSS87_000594 [Heliosperma pusillum]|nr:hypothetical protein KSS87_000594 [Heliosperma pusillum]
MELLRIPEYQVVSDASLIDIELHDFLYFNVSDCSLLKDLSGSAPDGFLPISPEGGPQPLFPFLAPSPLSPFTNSTIPKLSGMCPFDFSAAENLMGITSTDCFTAFAPFLANVICCPQLQATLAVLVGQSSKDTKLLALNKTLANHCLSDVDQVLVSQGANDNLQQICNIHSSNLTEGSCPVKDVSEFEATVNTSKLLAACGKINLVDECCTQTCQNAISEAAQNITSKDGDLGKVPQLSVIAEDCTTIVQRWLASKLHPSRAKEVLRGLTNCNINKVCPLSLPDTKHVVKKCANVISDKVACCSELESYLSHLQNQSFITNLQAVNCAAALGMKLQLQNVTSNVYNLCSVSLKKFSLQESGCLLQSLPSDVTFDQTTGITFLCDLNDNIPATWPSANQLTTSSCNKAVNIPALPAAASGQNGGRMKHHVYYFLIFLLAVPALV